MASCHDSDGDGLTDWVETQGWKTATGATYRTDPRSTDTDSDGLSDFQEAGEFSSDGNAVYEGLANPNKADSDDDGLMDKSELEGWASAQGFTFQTDPWESDTDRDTLTDAEEASVVAEGERPEGRAAMSDPTKNDTDADGLDDASEADLSLDAFAVDSDGDRLGDFEEVERFGTAADVFDTDDDGFDDGYEVANRESQGLDPLWPDTKIDASTYAREFAQGAVVGELMPGDSLAWFAGNLASGGASLVPGVGWLVGGVADARDTVGSAIHQDWVGAGLGVAGIVPVVGDAAVIPAKIAKFVARHPELAVSAGAVVAGLKLLPTDVQAAAARATAPAAYDYLRKSGTSAKSITLLMEGKVGLTTLAEAMKRSQNPKGTRTQFFATGLEGEKYLARQVTGAVVQKNFSTTGCVDVCNVFTRRVDVFASGIAHESKVGRVYLSPGIRRQIESDSYCIQIKECSGATWHFFPSSVSRSLGASEQVLLLLEERGIKYVIHPPK